MDATDPKRADFPPAFALPCNEVITSTVIDVFYIDGTVKKGRVMRILRGVGSRILPCGCLVGLYETYDRRTIAVIDGRAAACTDRTHRVNLTLPVAMVRRDNEPSPSIGS